MLGKSQIQMHTFKYSKSKHSIRKLHVFSWLLSRRQSHFPQCLQLLGANDYSKFLYGVVLSNLIFFQPLDTASSRMQTSEFGKSKGLWKSLSESTWSEAFDGLGISLLLTSNPSIQVTERSFSIFLYVCLMYRMIDLIQLILDVGGCIRTTVILFCESTL